MSSPISEGRQVAVSIIVPARNEEASLGRCLQSLVAQEDVAFEIIVVDDGSTDATPHIAQSFATGAPGRVRFIAAPPLPAGWKGKSNACWTGAQIARGEWILFTDADTCHRPGSLERAVAEAQAHGAVLLSYSPAQEVHTLAERALMPVIFAELACTFRPRDVCDPASPTAAANGQYLLVRRADYFDMGGHATVARDLLEDVALARLFKRAGRTLRFRFGGDAVTTRMYRNWEEMRQGWTKNLVLLFPDARQLATRRSREFAASVGAGALAAAAFRAGHKRVASVAAGISAVTFARLFHRIRRAHFDPLSTALAPFGLPLFAYLLRNSERAHRQGSVKWKGREYEG